LLTFLFKKSKKRTLFLFSILQQHFQTSIVGFLAFFREETAGKLPIRAVIGDAFAAFSVP